MDKKLPSIFANKIDKKLNNNERVYYSNTNQVEEKVNNENQPNIGKLEMNINQKINSIFKSNKYVYKADVIITTKEGKFSKKIIGQNKTHLITMNNELIPISDILDIEFSN